MMRAGPASPRPSAARDSRFSPGSVRVGVADRVDRALDMHDVVVVEAAQDLRDRIDLADVAEELVAEPLALRGAAHQARDVDEFELGRDDLGRFGEAGAHRKALVRHRDPPDIGFDRAERVIRRLGRGGRGQRVEQGRLADIRQADDAAIEAHDFLAKHDDRPRIAGSGHVRLFMQAAGKIQGLRPQAGSVATTMIVTLSIAPRSSTRSSKRSADHCGAAPPISRAISASETMFVSPSLHRTRRSPGSSASRRTANSTGPAPTARVTMCDIGWLAASSGRSKPASTISWTWL